MHLKSIAKKVAWRLFPNVLADIEYQQSLKHHISFYGGYDDKDMATYIDENFHLFLTDEQLADEKLKKRLIRDIIICYHRYGTNPNEYFCYHFPERTEAERATYLPRLRKDLLLCKQMGPDHEKYFNLIKDKNLFYQQMKPFFKREACRVEEEADRDEFVRMLTTYCRLICKPTRGGCGSGIEIVSLESYGEDASKAFNHLLSQGGYIAEEVVEQDSRISEWNASSLNTFRIPTFRTKEGVKIFYPSIRIGRSGCIVDNAGAGGTFAAIDPETGALITDGFDKHGNHYLVHPDSHKPYKGAQIPEWDALKKFVEEAHLAMPPEHKYIAYDMALSTKGWVLIEANWGEISMPQIEFGRGLKEEFENMLFSC